MCAFFSRGFGDVASRKQKFRAMRFPACVAEQLEARGMLSGIGIAVTPPLAPANTDSPVVIAPPPAAASGSASSPVTLPVLRDPAVTLPVVRESLRISMPSQARAGVPINVTAVAVDAAGRPRSSFNGSATVVSTDPEARLPLVPVTFRNGRASFQVTLSTAGRQSITVRSLMSDAPVSGTATTAITAAQVASRFAVTLPRAVAVGVPVTVTLVALDAQGRPVTSHRGIATLTSTDAKAKFPPTVTFVNGRATVRVVFGTLGPQTLSASQGTPSAPPSGGIVGSGTTQVAEVVTQRIRL
jgi:hypothetical protein